jgi:hypothetical protein
MSVAAQAGRCPVHPWCTVTRRHHRVHTGEEHRLATVSGVELRLTLHAENRHPPVVEIEAALAPSGTLLEVAELEAAQALELAGVLRRLVTVLRGPPPR